MKKAYFKMCVYNIIFQKKQYNPTFVAKILIAKLLCCLSFSACCYSNDFDAFPKDTTATYLQPLSTAQQQTDIAVQRATNLPQKTPKQISLLKQANKERNGMYIMASLNMVPIQRLLNNEPLYIAGMGFGIRGGVISYLDEYIGMRGYFALDFTSDNLSPLHAEINVYNGTFLMASLGLDIMIDFFIDKNYKNTLGFFAGIGAGAFIYFDMKTSITAPSSQEGSNYKASGNVMVQGGFSASIAYHHRVEIGVRFLPTQSFRIEQDGFVADYNPYVAYSYKF
ncbi:outer membrane beta-barrel protein [Helicobacter trogontum]|nr:outer membrane beta-barrel protein [Helicobacter trogontum]